MPRSPKPPGTRIPVHAFEDLGEVRLGVFQIHGVDVFDVHICVMEIAGVFQASTMLM